jgi:hypothetical protein
MAAVQQVQAVTQDLRAAHHVPPAGQYNGFPMPRTNTLPPLGGASGAREAERQEMASDRYEDIPALRTPVTINYPSGPVDPLLSVLAEKIGYSFIHHGGTKAIRVSVILKKGTAAQALRMIEGQLPAGAQLVVQPRSAALFLQADGE